MEAVDLLETWAVKAEEASHKMRVAEAVEEAESTGLVT